MDFLRPLILLGAIAALPAFGADRPAKLPDTMAQRMAACTACHASQDPNGQYFPRIAGKPAGYLYNQLVNFRDGRRQFPMMTYMVNHMPDDYLREIATYFAGEHLPPPSVQPTDAGAAALARGRQLVLQGDPAIRMPACVACHGAQLTGVAPAIPGLLGLPRDYVNAQFGAWRTGARRAHRPDCMADIANRLSLADVSAVSAWLGLQPVAPDARPAAALTAPLPIRCGSAP